MKLGFLTAAFPDLTLEQVAEWAAAEGFETLEVAWTWRGDNFGPSADPLFRATPLYVDGLLYTVAGQRRTVAASTPMWWLRSSSDIPRAWRSS